MSLNAPFPMDLRPKLKGLLPTQASLPLSALLALLSVTLSTTTARADDDVCARLAGCGELRSQIQSTALQGGDVSTLGPWIVQARAPFLPGGTLRILPESAFSVDPIDGVQFRVRLINASALFRSVFGQRVLVNIGASYAVSGTGGSVGNGSSSCELMVRFRTNAGWNVNPQQLPAEARQLRIAPPGSAEVVRITNEGFYLVRRPEFERTPIQVELPPVTDASSGLTLQFTPQALGFCTIVNPEPRPTPTYTPTPEPTAPPVEYTPAPTPRPTRSTLPMIELGVGYNYGSGQSGEAHSVLLRVESGPREIFYVRAELALGESNAPGSNVVTYANIRLTPFVANPTSRNPLEQRDGPFFGMGALPMEFVRDPNAGINLSFRIAALGFEYRSMTAPQQRAVQLFARMAAHLVGYKYQELRQSYTDYFTGRVESNPISWSGLFAGALELEGGLSVLINRDLTFKLVVGAMGDLTVSDPNFAGGLPVSYQAFSTATLDILDFLQVFARFTLLGGPIGNLSTNTSVGIGFRF
jgi:hypothetical protein